MIYKGLVTRPLEPLGIHIHIHIHIHIRRHLVVSSVWEQLCRGLISYQVNPLPPGRTNLDT